MTETTRPRMIDAHHHLWPMDAVAVQHWRPMNDEILRHAFEMDVLEPELASAGVAGTVLMQAADDPSENARLFAYAAESPLIKGVVAWAPLTRSQDARTIIEDLDSQRSTLGGSKLVGVRCLIGGSAADWALEPGSLDNFQRMADRGMTWDVVPITLEQVESVTQVAHRVPDLKVIIDHLARPPFRSDGWSAWCHGIARLANEPGIAMKLSVGVDALSSEAEWDRSALRPYVEYALDVFGPSRSMIASNWPVVLLKTSYADAWADMLAIITSAISSLEDLTQVTSDTACTWYSLND